jgi:hypothetical protein
VHRKEKSAIPARGGKDYRCREHYKFKNLCQQPI